MKPVACTQHARSFSQHGVALQGLCKKKTAAPQYLLHNRHSSRLGESYAVAAQQLQI